MVKLMTTKTRVAVLMGGMSFEHDVSLNTGEAIVRALDRAKYRVTPVMITKKGMWSLPRGVVSTGDALHFLTTSIDVVVIALHGAFGEDGRIQALLEVAGIPYTGSGVLASALAMDKVRAKELFSFHGMLTPQHISFSRNEWKRSSVVLMHRVRAEIGYPCVVKPFDSGSSVGVVIVRTTRELRPAIIRTFSYGVCVMVEEYLEGDEVTCGVIDDGRTMRALSPAQIIPVHASFFDYDAKYIPNACEEVIPARLPIRTLKAIQDNAVHAHRVLGCAGMSRTDMIVVGRKGKAKRQKGVYVLETNTIPGMTRTSVLPQELAVAKISFSRFFDILIRGAMQRER
jgi:D-alanine-D-alanine ligase